MNYHHGGQQVFMESNEFSRCTLAVVVQHRASANSFAKPVRSGTAVQSRVTERGTLIPFLPLLHLSTRKKSEPEARKRKSFVGELGFDARFDGPNRNCDLSDGFYPYER